MNLNDAMLDAAVDDLLAAGRELLAAATRYDRGEASRQALVRAALRLALVERGWREMGVDVAGVFTAATDPATAPAQTLYLAGITLGRACESRESASAILADLDRLKDAAELFADLNRRV